MVVFDNFKDQSGLIQWLNIPVRAIYLSQPRKLCVNSLNDITSLAKSRCQDLLQAQEAFFSFLTLYKTVSTVQPWLPCHWSRLDMLENSKSLCVGNFLEWEKPHQFSSEWLCESVSQIAKSIAPLLWNRVGAKHNPIFLVSLPKQGTY